MKVIGHSSNEEEIHLRDKNERSSIKLIGAIKIIENEGDRKLNHIHEIPFQ
jgi:hypothetical protein